MKGLRLYEASGNHEVGALVLENGVLQINVPDDLLAEKIDALARKSLRYLKDDGDEYAERTILATAEPGTEEHLRVLMFELRKIGLESRIQV